MIIDLGMYRPRCPSCRRPATKPIKLRVTYKKGQPNWALAATKYSYDAFCEAIRRFYGTLHPFIDTVNP